ncbi:MAG: hypothetical protein NT172_05385 [Planctomycetota bacterium]|nr:hypothetical protein [Planctomycetota bacterium]
MTINAQNFLTTARTLLLGLWLTTIPNLVRADKFTMKTGEIYVGHAEREGVIAGAYDGVKRTLFRATRMASQEPGAGSSAWESFKLIQPRKTNFVSNQMPTILTGMTAEAWDEFGRRKVRYSPPRNVAKTVELTQALIELGPKASKVRGVETYWSSQVSTSIIPRNVIVGLLNRIPKEEKDERLRVVRFYLQAGWFTEAKAAVSALKADFPEFNDVLNNAAAGIYDAELTELMVRWKGQLKGGTPVSVIRPELEKTLKTAEGASAAVRASGLEMLDLINATDELRSRRLRELKAAFDGSRQGNLNAGPGPQYLAEMIEALSKCPEIAEPFFAPFDQYLRNPDGVSPKKAWSIALSAWSGGLGLATDDISVALAYAEAYETITKAAHSPDQADRSKFANRLESLQIPGPEGDRPLSAQEAQTITERVRPLNTLSDDTKNRTLTYRVENDTNPTPTEYLATVPPGYHRLGQWPAMIVLNPGGDPDKAAVAWRREAAERGWIVLAPDLKSTGPYHFSTDEHATVTLCLRDALKRLAINPDRVFVAGGLGGGDMAWDYALAHPDSLAGGIVLSGLPAKYVPPYRANTQMVPLFIVEGELAPGEPQVVMPLVKTLMQKNWDATYVQYQKRGYEFFEEEIPTIFDWASGRRRKVDVDEFQAVAAREGDQRFYGLIISEFATGRSLAPESVNTLGENLKPATLAAKFAGTANQIQITSDGIKALDIWISPRQIDFTKRMDIKLGGRSRFKGMPKVDWNSFLDDLASRGDTRQTYFMKVEIR